MDDNELPNLRADGGMGDESVARSMRSAAAMDLLSNYRLTPATLMAKLDPTWIPSKWLQFLSLKIASAISRGNCGLLISAPPRHGKSQLSTIATPLWTLENFPSKSVVVATYGEELSTDFSRKIRDLMNQNQDLLSVRMRDDARRVTNILTTKGGGLKAVGLRGAITGRGADVFVIDDYIKEPKEAESPTYLEDLWTWYRTVARTRLEPGAVVIILATRWVANDLHGRIMKKQKESGRHFFDYIEMPAIATHEEGLDIVGRRPGEVLFPERYDEASVLDLKEDLGTRWFNAMFQQKPDDEETALIKLSDFRKITQQRFDTLILDWKARGNKLVWGRAWDMASLKDKGDYTSGPRCVYNKDTKEFVIESMARGQWSPQEAEAQFERLVEKDFQSHPSFKVGMEQEPGSSGKYTVRHFEKIGRQEAGVKKLRIEGFTATNSKQLNAQPFIAAVEAGRVYIVTDPKDIEVTEADDHTGWVRDLFLELEKFPESEYDDQVDSLSITYKMLTGKKTLGAAIGRNREKDLKEMRRKDKAGDEPGSKRQSPVTFGRSSFISSHNVGRLGI